MSDGEEFMKASAQVVKSMGPAIVSASKAFQELGASLGSLPICGSLPMCPPLMFKCRCSCPANTSLAPDDQSEEVVNAAGEELSKERQNPLVISRYVIGRYGRCLSR